MAPASIFSPVYTIPGQKTNGFALYILVIQKKITSFAIRETM